MRRYIFTTGILFMMLTFFGIMPLMAQDSKQYAVFNYRNDGQFNAFLNHKIDSITYSCIDTLGIEHDDVVVQEVWTPDSVYRIPLNAIDSLAFHAPEPKMRSNLFYIRDYHADYTISIDSLTLYFKTAISADSLPAIGQVVLSVTEKTPFEEGFAGRVREINRRDDRIEIVCVMASLCDVFERLVVAGTAVSDEDEYEAILKARRADGDEFDAGGGAAGGGGRAWDELLNEKDHIDAIKGLPEEWKATILDLYTIKSKNPRVECFYSVNVTLWDFDVNVDFYIHHDDLTYTLTFDWDKISKMGEKYKKFKEVWDLLKDGNFDAVREKEKELDEKSWEEKMRIGPFFAGPLNCSIDIGGMLKPEGLNLKISKEEKTTALQHAGLNVKGYTNKFSYWYDKIATAFSSESIWDALEVSKYDVTPSFSFDQEPYSSVNWDVKLSGSFTAGVFLRFNISLLTKYLIRASLGAETGVKFEGTADFKLYDSDYEDVGNEHLDANPSASSGIYSVLKDTNFDAKWYVKFKGETGALFDLLNLSGEKELKIWEGKFYLMPHFTKPALTTDLSGYQRWENEKFTTTVSKDIIPLLKCYPGLGVYRYSPTLHGMALEKMIEYTDPEPYKYIFAEDNPERDEELSIYNKGLVPGTEYYCYPIFKMFNHTFKAGPYITFTYPKPLTLENPSLILQKDIPQLVRINGGWGDYDVNCYPKDVVKAELVTSGDFSQVRLTTLKAGTATVEVRDKRSLEKASIEVKVFGSPEEGTAITVSEEKIDYGTMAYGNSDSKSFKVTNHGSKELCFSIDDSQIDRGFTVEGSNEIQYLQPGEYKTFTVIAKGIGPDHIRKGTLLITSNATKDPVPIELEVKGKATSVKYVDLGLSVKWAECNLGALEAAGGPGDFFAWGETESKTSYGWNNYIHCDGTAETCHSIGDISGTDNDAAHYQWGGKWRMPTAEELKELKEKCTWTWDNSLQMVGGLPGYKITGPNGKSIFLEAAGLRKEDNIMEAERQGLYFSSNQGESDLQTAQALIFENGTTDLTKVTREMGISIRPVYDENMQGLQLSTTSLTLTSGSEGTVDITSGSGSYAAVSNATSVATVTVDGSKLIIKGVSPGPATITVKDNKTQERAKIEVTVSDTDQIKTETFTVNGVSFKMVGVEGGTFQMGSEFGDSDEMPVHFVTLNNFYIGETEVTQELWKAVMGSNNSAFTESEKLPVDALKWEDCQSFIDKLNELTGYSFRLPTEAEWEYAARGGNASNGYIYSGSNVIEDVAWYSQNSNRSTQIVASKKANELGLYDMSGNVWEWCQDYYGAYNPEAQINPVGPSSGSDKVLRGGGYGSPIKNCRVTNRDDDTPSSWGYGMRLVLSDGGTPQAYLTCPDNHHPHLIDLGLPSGTKWACCNVGATKPEEYGGYYAWGETEEKEVYTRNNYKLNHASVVSNISGTQYDVAHVKWGDNWVMPTYEQQQELVDNCTSEWITLNGVNGRKITGPNGNSIFLPAAGFRGGDLWYAGVEGRYRSSTQYPKNSDQAYYLGFGSNYLNWGGGYRLEGYSVRPVIHSTPTLADLTLSSTGPITVKVDDKATVEITSGNGDYTAASDNEDVAIARVYDNATVMIKGISVGTATVSVTDTKSGQTAAITVTVTGTINPDVSPGEAIDLGLPSGTKWASCNVGASKPEEYGGYYAWGETEEKEVYKWSTYIHCDGSSSTCHDLGSDISGTDYDVAHVKWGDKWCMPTLDEIKELLKYCTTEWTTLNGVNGRKFTSKINGNSIFLPAAGYPWDGGLDDAGEFGGYWSSTQNPDFSNHAFGLNFRSYGAYRTTYYRSNGLSVRPVVRN